VGVFVRGAVPFDARRRTELLVVIDFWKYPIPRGVCVLQRDYIFGIQRFAVFAAHGAATRAHTILCSLVVRQLVRLQHSQTSCSYFVDRGAQTCLMM